MSAEAASTILSGACTVRSVAHRGPFCRITLRIPHDFPEPRPGQFILISCRPTSSEYFIPSHGRPGTHLPAFAMGPSPDRTLLPLPMSIFDYKRPSGLEPGQLDLLFKIVGRGTLSLSELATNSTLRLVGPLGNGFQTNRWKKALLVGGGVGFSGIHFLAKTLASGKRPALCILGINSRDESPMRLSTTEVPPPHRWVLPKTTEPLGLVVSRLFEMFTPSMVASMYPGDQGAFSGTACDLVERLFEANPTYAPETTLIACGPRPMLRVLADVARHKGVKEFLVLLEENMACGLGTCLGCAVQLRENRADGLPGAVVSKRVCTDGPVFDGYQVLWEKE